MVYCIYCIYTVSYLVVCIHMEKYHMFLHLSDLSDESLQSQIIRQISSQILSGDLAPSMPLPSIRRLAADQKVSIITVQQAYTRLTEKGLIHSRRGKGFFVSDLSEETRNTLAVDTLKNAAELPIRTALNMGLSRRRITGIITELLNKTVIDGGSDA